MSYAPKDATPATATANPAAVAVSGWDDSDAAGPAGLTTLRQSLRDQGKRCAHIAVGHLRPGQFGAIVRQDVSAAAGIDDHQEPSSTWHALT
jgi:hypothetical protein